MTSPRYGHQCAKTNDTIVVVGGLTNSLGGGTSFGHGEIELWKDDHGWNNFSNAVTINSNKWITRFTMATFNNDLLIFGGIIQENTEALPLKQVYRVQLNSGNPSDTIKPFVDPMSNKTHEFANPINNAVVFKIPYGYFRGHICQGMDT